MLFDRKESGYYVGCTYYDSPEVEDEMLVPAKNAYVRLGNLANVRITESTYFDLYGALV